MTKTTKSDIVEEYEKIKNAEQDRMSLRQDVDPKNIFSADRVEELLSFPIGPEESLQKTDHIYITDDNKRLLLIREYDDKRKSRSKNKLSSDDSLSRMDITPPLKSKEIISTSRSVRMDKRPYELCQENGYVIDFKVSIDENSKQCPTHQIHVRANCPAFIPKDLYINGIRFSQNSTNFKK